MNTAVCRCDLWPDANCAFYFDVNRNFSLVLKRDPCIHNGSIVGIERVYVYERGIQHNESIHVSSFILKHLNADFDGDTVTIMIVRGIESSCELRECLTDPLLFGTIPRFTFSQSMILWIFRMLAFDDATDEMTAVIVAVGGANTVLDPRTASALLHERLDLWSSADARRRARRVFGPWYRNYRRVLRKIWHRQRQRQSLLYRGSGDDDQWSVPVWRRQPVLDAVYVDAVYKHNRSSSSRRQSPHPSEIFAWMQRNVLTYGGGGGGGSIGATVLLDKDIFCLENWMIVHSGAKATPRDLWSLNKRFEQHIHQKHNNCNTCDDDRDNELSTQLDFFKECPDDKEQEYVRYLDDFVVISKHVPKSSYFASGLKWVTQMCSIADGNLYMRDTLLLRDIAYYLKATTADDAAAADWVG